jgi:hypothetical protein
LFEPIIGFGSAEHEPHGQWVRDLSLVALSAMLGILDRTRHVE